MALAHVFTVTPLSRTNTGIFLLRTNETTERMSMKFADYLSLPATHYILVKIVRGTREQNTTENSNRHQKPVIP